MFTLERKLNKELFISVFWAYFTQVIGPIGLTFAFAMSISGASADYISAEGKHNASLVILICGTAWAIIAGWINLELLLPRRAKELRKLEPTSTPRGSNQEQTNETIAAAKETENPKPV
jgi:hypothetical protein